MKKEVKVGIFVTLGLALMALSIFLIGDNRKIWDPSVTYTAAFADVAGLKSGSPVRMGGVDVGTVGKLGHGGDANDSRIYVELNVVKSESRRVRQDTVAKVVNKGLLGDKMVELSVADAASPAMPAGGRLKSEEPLDFNKYITKFESIADKAEKAVGNIEAATRGFGDPQLADDVKGSVKSLRAVLDAVAQKDSVVHRLFFDAEEARKVDQTINELAAATGQLNGALGDVHALTTQARNGPGIAHALLYDGDISAHAAGVMSEVHKDLVAVREGNGLLHAFIYGDDKTQHVMGNVDAMTNDLRQIVAGVRAGKGTIGGLLVDPSIYEDIKSLVGNLDRNQVLRALVRYSIKQDEQRPASKP